MSKEKKKEKKHGFIRVSKNLWFMLKYSFKYTPSYTFVTLGEALGRGAWHIIIVLFTKYLFYDIIIKVCEIRIRRYLVENSFQSYIEKIKKINSSGKKYAYVQSFGCQLNFSDGEKIKGILSQMNYEITDSCENADVIFFNTCAVRDNAEQKLKEERRRAQNAIIAELNKMSTEQLKAVLEDIVGVV